MTQLELDRFNRFCEINGFGCWHRYCWKVFILTVACCYVWTVHYAVTFFFTNFYHTIIFFKLYICIVLAVQCTDISGHGIVPYFLDPSVIDPQSPLYDTLNLLPTVIRYRNRLCGKNAEPQRLNLVHYYQHSLTLLDCLWLKVHMCE